MASNDGGCSPKCPSGSKNSPGGRSRTRTTTRTNIASVSRSPLYVDGATLNAMMANLETFGHGLGQFSPQRSTERYGSGRVPYSTNSSPQGLGNLQSPHESYGPQMDYSIAWAPGVVDPSMVDRTPPVYDDTNQFLLTNEELSADVRDESIDSKRKESIIEWFDRSVEQELEKRRDMDSSNANKSLGKLEEVAAAAVHAAGSPKSPNVMRGLAEATASGVEIIGELLREKDADLLDAVEKFATAEAMCNFAGAVEAAEEACKAAPLECAEEAAAAGVRGYQREITNIVKQTIPGEHPIEVVGYVGVTKPKFPKKPAH